MPQLVVVAGPNGSGKSTYTASAAEGFSFPPLDPDAFPGSPIEAGRAAILKVRTALAAGEPIFLETTLSGHFALDVMNDARKSGYDIDLIYISTSDVEINIQRVANRVARGGHNVPEIDIRRRYGRSLRNLKAAIELADRVLIFDNSANAPVPFLSIENGRRVALADFPDWAKRYINDEVG